MSKLKTELNQSAVVAKALLRASDFMNIKKKELAAMMKINQSTLTRALNNGIEPQSLKGEVGLMVIRVYRSLSALSGNNHDFMTHFLRTNNKYFNAKPIDVMQSMEGLVMLNNYLDGMRGKV